MGSKSLNSNHRGILKIGDALIQVDEEWVNSLTHGIGVALSCLAAVFLIHKATQVGVGYTLACSAYMLAVAGTFLASMLSHTFLRQPLLDTLRAWDQAMIYTMISGTYTPIIYRFAPDNIRTPLLIAVWGAAALGFSLKILVRHRINSIGTISYLLLGWLPALPILNNLPSSLTRWMLLGGIVYSLGTILLVNDHRLKYLHASWHISVIAAAFCHFIGIYWYASF